MPSCIIGITLLNFIQQYFLYHNPEGAITGLPISLGSGTGAAILCLSLAWFLSRPFDRIYAKAEKGETCSQDEIAAAFKSLKNVNTLSFILITIGFVSGQTIVMIIKMMKGTLPVLPTRIVYTETLALMSGLYVAFFCVFVFNVLAAPMRACFGVHDIKKYSRFTSISFSKEIIIITIFALFYLALIMMAPSFEVMRDIEAAALPGAHARYIKDCILLFLIMILPILLVFIIVCREHTRRIQKAADLVNGLADEGKLNDRLNLTMFDDLDILITSINVYIKQQQMNIQALKQDSTVVNKANNVLKERADSSNTALESLNDAISNIRDENAQQNKLITNMNSDMSGLADGISNVVSQVQMESGSIEQSSAAIEEMVANINSVSKMANDAQDLSKNLSRNTESGQASLTTAIKAVNAIQETSSQVTEVIKTIKKISGQTNLLSMNAAIESAHAGAAGRGFAIVADEVRSLSETTAKSVSQIDKLIKEMVSDINTGVAEIKTAGEAFTNIRGMVEKTDSLIQTIALAIEEERAGAADTLNSTSEIVRSIALINDLSKKQKEYVEHVTDMMTQVVSSSQDVSQTLDRVSDLSLTVSDAVSDVSSAVENTEKAMDGINQKIDYFKI